MPDIALLSLDRATFLALHRRTEAGDETALAEIAAMWDRFGGGAIECWLCRAPTSSIPRWAITFPENHDPTRLVAACCCENCRTMDPTLRRRRSLALIRSQYSKPAKAKGGARVKQTHLVRVPEHLRVR
jgi:hypothetical protein